MESQVGVNPLVKILRAAECIIHESVDFEKIFEENCVASPPIVDVSVLSLSTRRPIEAFSSTIDPFEPTPIGPSIKIVGDALASAPVGGSLQRFNTSTTKQANSSFFNLPGPSMCNFDVNNSMMAPFSSPSSRATARCSRKLHDEQWNQRFEDLLKFRHQHGHALVQHKYSENLKLSQWVKRYVLYMVQINATKYT
jgi:hypothetical protein